MELEEFKQMNAEIFEEYIKVGKRLSRYEHC